MKVIRPTLLVSKTTSRCIWRNKDSDFSNSRYNLSDTSKKSKSLFVLSTCR